MIAANGSLMARVWLYLIVVTVAVLSVLVALRAGAPATAILAGAILISAYDVFRWLKRAVT